MDKAKENTNTVHGLVKRRRDLQANADHIVGKLAAIQADILTLDNAIRLMGPSFRIGSISPKKLAANRAQLRPFQYDVIQCLSSDGGWLSAQEIAIRVILRYEKQTKKEKALTRARIRGFLYRQTKHGLVVRGVGVFQIDSERKWYALI